MEDTASRLNARVDHVVVAVADLAEASERWRAEGIPVAPGGQHPVGTENALVRGPQPAYVELIAARPGTSGPWPDRVRDSPGPLSWVVAVDDIEEARRRLVARGFTPGEIRAGSRTTPDGTELAWLSCDVGPVPFDSELPFVIQWTQGMPPGPADGPVVTSVSLRVPDPERLTELLTTLGLTETFHGPWVAFSDGAVSVSVSEGEPGLYALSFGMPGGAHSWRELDGIHVNTGPDLRSHRGFRLLPAVETAYAAAGPAGWPDPHRGAEPAEEEYSRCTDPARYHLVVARARAWVTALHDEGLATVEETDGVVTVTPTEPGALPLVLTIRGFEGFEDNLVEISAGDALLAMVPDCGCDACDSGSADLVDQVDSTILHVLDGGVLRVRAGDGREVLTTADGWSASGVFADGEPDEWLATAERGISPHEVTHGAPWL